MKKVKNKNNEYLSIVMPLIEELVENDLVPVCVIGFRPGATENDPVNVLFATHNEESDLAIIEMCKQIIASTQLKQE